MTSATLVQDRRLAEELRAERRASGTDRWDEVWDGVYVLMPLPDDEHQRIVGKLTMILELTIGENGLGEVRPGVNVSDRVVDWTRNYRCPDVAVFLVGTTAESHGTFWLGGPDFAVEVVSPDDRSREKLPFYARIGTRELLVIDREPWSLELYRLGADALELVGRHDLDRADRLESAVLPLAFVLDPAGADGRPRIIVTRADGTQSWRI